MTRTPPSWPDILDGATRLHLKIGESVEVMWLRHGDPLPEGYAPADSDVVEHGKHHARLIYRTFPVEHSEGER